jgi:hypothetical protein
MRTLILAALLLPAPALAQETRASAAAKLDAEFAGSDTNKDGFLSLAELQARMGKMKVQGGEPLPPAKARQVAQLFLTRADSNKDKRVSKAESQAMMRAVFARYDVNGDGTVGGAEAAKARAAARAKVK